MAIPQLRKISEIRSGNRFARAGPMQIEKWITRDPVCVTPDDTLEKASQIMACTGFRQLPVAIGKKLVGIITERDLRAHRGPFQTILAASAMSANPITVSLNDSAEDATRLLIKHKIGGLPVVEAGKLIGIVTTTDLLVALLGILQAVQQRQNPKN
jgi:acetoin utilization protein AcuB